MDKSKIIEKLTTLAQERQELLGDIARINQEEWERDEPARKERELKRKREYRQQLKERKQEEARATAEREAKWEANQQRLAALKKRIREQKPIVDALVAEATRAQEISMAHSSARHAVMKQEVARATADLRKQLADLEAATWSRLSDEPESKECDRLDAEYVRLRDKAYNAQNEIQAICEFHSRKSVQEAKDCTSCCYVSTHYCEICGAPWYRSEGDCRCNSSCG